MKDNLLKEFIKNLKTIRNSDEDDKIKVKTYQLTIDLYTGLDEFKDKYKVNK